MKKISIILTILLIAGVYSGCDRQKKDLQAVCQLTIDLPDLQQYYHIKDAPGRKTLVIMKNKVLKKKIKLRKFGKKVLFYTEAEIPSKKVAAYLEFTYIEIFEKSAMVKFRYPVEGIIGWVTFKKIDHTWAVSDHIIAEK